MDSFSSLGLFFLVPYKQVLSIFVLVCCVSVTQYQEPGGLGCRDEFAVNMLSQSCGEASLQAADFLPWLCLPW